MIQLTDIYKPIFIVGSPRSGTTMIYDFLAGHKDVAWFSQLDFTENYSQEYRRFLDLRRRIFSVRKWHYFPEGNETRLRTTFEIPDEFGNFLMNLLPIKPRPPFKRIFIQFLKHL